jgi:nucleoside-diphosphate-sugar epimerase
MRIVVAGASGKIARLLAPLLLARGDSVVGLVRKPEQVAELTADGVDARLRDLESSSAAEVAADLVGADAVVFAAGAGPGSGAERKDTVDRAAATLLADAAEIAGVRRYLLVSSMGVESVRDGAVPAGVDEVFVAYLRAKLAAEDDVLARPGLGVTVLRPGALTDDPPTGTVTLARTVDRGAVPRADVAAVLVALSDVDGRGEVLELIGGTVPVADAVRRAIG